MMADASEVVRKTHPYIHYCFFHYGNQCGFVKQLEMEETDDPAITLLFICQRTLHPTTEIPASVHHIHCYGVKGARKKNQPCCPSKAESRL